MNGSRTKMLAVANPPMMMTANSKSCPEEQQQQALPAPADAPQRAEIRRGKAINQSNKLTILIHHFLFLQRAEAAEWHQRRFSEETKAKRPIVAFETL